MNGTIPSTPPPLLPAIKYHGSIQPNTDQLASSHKEDFRVAEERKKNESRKKIKSKRENQKNKDYRKGVLELVARLTSKETAVVICCAIENKEKPKLISTVNPETKNKL